MRRPRTIHRHLVLRLHPAGVYRYSFRMATHGDARADAPELAHIDLGPRFAQLVRALAADGVDFTKGPRNPADQFLEAACNRGRR